MQFVHELNRAVRDVADMPRPTFPPSCSGSARGWWDKKHVDGLLHEPATAGAFLAVSRRFRCPNIFDVGALFGYFSVLSAKLFPYAHITAFEMLPHVYRDLKKIVGEEVTCVNTIVSDHSDESKRVYVSGFNIFEKPDLGWEDLANNPAAMRVKNTRGFFKSKFISLDDYAEHLAWPDLIKIDVEAYQTRAILGAAKMIEKAHPIIIIELHDAHKVALMGTTNQETVQPMFDAGYRGYWCGDHRSLEATFVPFDRITPDKDRLSIAVFIP